MRKRCYVVIVLCLGLLWFLVTANNSGGSSEADQSVSELVQLVEKLTERIEALEQLVQILEARVQALEAEKGKGETIEWYQVRRVIDGDTILISTGESVRYLGIDTPETVDPRKPVEYFGKEAAEYNRKLIFKKKVRLEFDVQKRDNYGRLLAYVYLEDGTFVNAELVKNGYAKVATYPPNVKYVDLFQRLQQEAQAAGRGLWGIEPPKETTEQTTTKEPPKQEQNDIVYITNTGKKYHRAGCRYLSKSAIPIRKKEAIARGYTLCSVCKP